MERIGVREHKKCRGSKAYVRCAAMRFSTSEQFKNSVIQIEFHEREESLALRFVENHSRAASFDHSP